MLPFLPQALEPGDMSSRSHVALLTLVIVLAGCAGVSPEAPSTATSTPATSPTGTPAATPTPVPATQPQMTVTVTKVVDGDTLHIRYQNGTTDTVRLLGVDSPETYGETTPDEFEGVPDTAAGRECLSTWGERAKTYATERLAGRTVSLGFDPNEGRRGYYGRLLAYVWVDGAQFNYDLIRQGYARMYDSSFVERTRYAPAEERAREARRGLWTCATPTGGGSNTSTATTASPASTPLDVSVHPDAAGNDNQNLNEEYVRLTNTGDTVLDLAGWTVADAAGHSYTFPDGTSLGPGESVTIHTGSGSNTETDHYWGQDSALWNNDGDTVIVRNATGEVVTRHQY